MFPIVKAPCKDCPDRSIDPPCHDPKICEKWRLYREYRNFVIKKRRETNIIDEAFNDIISAKK